MLLLMLSGASLNHLEDLAIPGHPLALHLKANHSSFGVRKNVGDTSFAWMNIQDIHRSIRTRASTQAFDDVIQDVDLAAQQVLPIKIGGDKLQDIIWGEGEARVEVVTHRVEEVLKWLHAVAGRARAP